MTPEGQRPPDDAPAPPASTRWSGEAEEGDDVLLPPYVPGGRSRPSSPDEAAGRESAPPAEPIPPQRGGEEAAAEEAAPEEQAGEEWAAEETVPQEPEYGYPEAGEDEPWGAGEPVTEAEPAADTVEPEPAGALPSLDAGFEAPHPSGPADRLEWLAEVLRREGVAGIQREVASGDRLTSLLAGVIAGYLAGRED